MGRGLRWRVADRVVDAALSTMALLQRVGRRTTARRTLRGRVAMRRRTARWRRSSRKVDLCGAVVEAGATAPESAAATVW